MIMLSKIKDKRRILKAARGKKITYKVIPTRLWEDFSAETLGARRVRWYNQSARKISANQEHFTQQSCPLEMRDKDFLNQTKAEVVQHQICLTRNAKRSSSRRIEKCFTYLPIDEYLDCFHFWLLWIKLL